MVDPSSERFHQIARECEGVVATVMVNPQLGQEAQQRIQQAGQAMQEAGEQLGQGRPGQARPGRPRDR